MNPSARPLARVARVATIAFSVAIVAAVLSAGAEAQSTGTEHKSFVPLSAEVARTIALGSPVTLSFDKVPLADAIAALAKAAGVSLTFDPTLPGLDRHISAKFERSPAASALAHLLDGTPIQAMVSRAGQIVLVARGAAASRTGVIDGTVRDAATGMPIPGARVDLVGTRFTTVTRERGDFSIGVIPSGSYTVRITRLGFHPMLVEGFCVPEDVGVPSLDVPMDLAPIALSAVVVTPGYFGMMESGLAAPQAMSRERIETVPQIAEDIYRAVNRLPGVTSNDFSADFYVRGGSGSELYVTLDGLELLEPFHLKDMGGGLSIIDSRAIGGVELITGGFSAEYGDRLTGVFGMRSLDPTAEPPQTSLGLSVMNARIMSQGQFGGRGGWLVSARRGYIDLALKLANTADSLKPRYYDLFAKAQYDLGRAGRVAVHALDAGDALTYLDTPDPSIRSRYRSSYGWATWTGRVGSRLRQQTVVSIGRLSWHRDGERIERGVLTALVDDRRSLRVGGVRQDWSLEVTPRALVKFGADVKRGAAKYDYFSRVLQTAVMHEPEPALVHSWDTTTVEQSPSTTRVGAYIAPRIRPLSSVTVEAGLRYDRSTHTGDDVVSPRLNVAWQPWVGTTLRGAWGRYAQSQPLSGLQAIDGVDEFYSAERAEHRVLGLEQALARGITTRVEAYDRRLSNSRPRFVSVGPPVEVFPEIGWDRVRIEPARGRARGAEVLFSRDAGGRVDWSAAYALASVFDRLGGRDVPRATDQRHTVSADWAYRAASNRWRFSLAGVWHTGWPYTPALIDVDTLENTPTRFVLQPRRFPGELNSERLPAYRRLDARYTRYVDTRTGRLSLFGEVYNLLDIHNRRGYYTNLNVDNQRRVTFTRGKQDWIPRLPTFGVTYEFGGAGR